MASKDTSGTTTKRSPAKRSPARRSSGRPTAAENKATKVVETTPPDTSGAATKPKSETTAELSQVEILTNSLKEDHARIKVDGQEVDIAEGATQLRTKVELAMGYARKVQSTYQQFTKANGVLASAFIDFREMIIMPDGKPDWFGGSKTYKDTISPLIDEAWKKDSGETRTTVVNRLQRRANRMLDERIALYTNVDSGFNMETDEVLRILQLEDKALQGDNATDTVKKFVAAVNKQYRTDIKVSPDDKTNRKASPFLPKTKNGKTTTPASQKPGDDALNTSKAFRVDALDHLTMPLALTEVLLLALDIRKKATGDTPAFSTPGKQGAVGLMTHIADVFYVTARQLDGHELDKNARESIEKAEKAAK
jgi:hypothetical protein